MLLVTLESRRKAGETPLGIYSWWNTSLIVDPPTKPFIFLTITYRDDWDRIPAFYSVFNLGFHHADH